MPCEGKIYANGKNIWFCTNHWELNGLTSPYRLGYKYSYRLDEVVRSIKVDGKELMEYLGYETPYRHSIVIPCSKVESGLVRDTYNNVEEGIHAYLSRKEAEEDVGDRYDLIIVECIVPKGAKYYEGEFNTKASIATNTLIYPNFAG